MKKALFTPAQLSKRRLKQIGYSLAVATSLAFSGLSHAAEKVKVGFVYVGPIGDHGWSYQHNKGREAIEEAFGDDVETTYVENVPEGADSERVMTQMALTGHDIIFTTSFGYMDPTIKVAKKFPKVKFEHSTGFKRSDNVTTYSSRFYEGRAVAGHIAGHMTKTDTIGYIASFPIPEVLRGINATYLHAKKVNPDVEIKVVWVYTWFDPAKEADAATALIGQGVDVILQHTDSPAAMTIAEEKGVFAIGQASDMSKFGPTAQLTSIINNWSPYYIDRVQAVMDGEWSSIDTWGGIGSGMVEMGTFSDKIPTEVQASALTLQAALSSGETHTFEGPLNKQDGSVWLTEGEAALDKDLVGLNFYVEGIDASIPE